MSGAPGGRRGGDAATRSLLMFVQALTERTLVLELRSDLVVRGRLSTVDDEMKCALSRPVVSARYSAWRLTRCRACSQLLRGGRRLRDGRGAPYAAARVLLVALLTRHAGAGATLHAAERVRARPPYPHDSPA